MVEHWNKPVDDNYGPRALVCEECESDAHGQCEGESCECLCREGWVKERFGWRLPIPALRVCKGK